MREYSEDALVEQPAIALVRDALGWETLNCFDEKLGPGGTLGRETFAEVVLTRRLRPALQRLNPGASAEAIEKAVEELARDRSALSLAQANREVYRLLKDGVKVRTRVAGEEDGGERDETIAVMDWDHPERNDFFLASQLWVTGDLYKRRADLVGFVNGLPLVFIELKATYKRLREAYDSNLRAYKTDIPQLFCYNALIILSNGSQTRTGSLTAGWEHFFEWKKISDERERSAVSLETALRGLCDKARLLDLAENFTLFSDAGGALTKVLAKNHQYLGVNRALAALRDITANQGRLGVFWHTQGSGKSYSMVFFTQKVQRTLPGNWTFLIVTDRDELDSQIYKTFAATGAATEPEATIQAQDGAHLKRMLGENHRVLFTLIQKFHIEPGQTYPTLSERPDIIVITDEAHRSQYDTLALNMRNALPRAAFLAFTGTPLMKEGEEKTRAVFGKYVSVYNFRQSVEDGATVPLYYENRVPALQLINEDLDDEMRRLIEAADLDEEQQRALDRQFAREYHLITRDDRLETIATDLVTHFMERGQRGKAMVVAIDKATAVHMYDKVQRHWRAYLESLRRKLTSAGEGERDALCDRIAYMESTDMAVVVSQSQNEIADFKAKDLDIEPHRRRMVKEDLETRFKDPADPLRIVFVCAMWMTGFDAPAVNTIYLDKPMRNHTLMQTIARANRVFGDKVNGLIVDYAGIFRDLQRALALYAVAPDLGDDALPIQDKAALVAQLRAALAEAEAFYAERGVLLPPILEAQGLAKVALLDDAVDKLLTSDETKRRALTLAAGVARLYRAILPDASANEYTARVAALAVIASKIKALLPPADITELMAEIDKLLDDSIAAEAYVIRGGSRRVAERPGEYQVDRRIDLSKIDFDALRAHFATAHKHTEAERLRGALNARLVLLVLLNHSRASYQDRLRLLIAAYNAGSLNVEVFFEELVALAKDLSVEEQRAVREGLTEEELALFDTITQKDTPLTDKEREQVKRIARDLLATLKREALTLDWKQRQQTRAQVRLVVATTLDSDLPATYSREEYQRICDAVYHHIEEAYPDATHNRYTQAS